MGYVAAPTALTAEFRKVHQFNVFAVNTPVQHGLAAYLRDPQPHLQLAAFYQRKRDLFAEGVRGTRLRPLASAGTYFQCADYSGVSDEADTAFCERLTREIGVAAIPMSAFYEKPVQQGLIRFCFAKEEATLTLALERLRLL